METQWSCAKNSSGDIAAWMVLWICESGVFSLVIGNGWVSRKWILCTVARDGPASGPGRGVLVSPRDAPACWPSCFRGPVLWGACASAVQRDMEDAMKQGREWLMRCYPQAQLCWGVLAQATSEAPRLTLHVRWWVGSTHWCWRGIGSLRSAQNFLVLASRSHILGNPCAPGQPGWPIILLRMCVCLLGPHTKCHLTEAERPTDHRIPPSAEPGKAT